MIYLVTGTPGAGKSLYAVSHLVHELVNRKLVRKGQQVKRRLLVDGVSGLLIPHELLAPGEEREDGSLAPGEGFGIWNWFEWCQPGDVIFIDEVQRWFRPRGMGTKPPQEIKLLETHRHLGIDFVFVTQNPMLLDQNIRRLVYRHQHIRRLWGMQRAVIYEWDSTAENVKSTKAATLSYWNYPKSAYALYHSSDLHTKPKASLPVWAWLPILAVVGGLLVAPKAYSVMHGAMTGKGVAVKPAESAAAAPGDFEIKPGQVPPGFIPASQSAGPSVDLSALPPGSVTSSKPDQAEASGCIYTVQRGCRCFDGSGKPSPVLNAELCADLASDRAPAIVEHVVDLSRSRVSDPADLDALAFLAKQRDPRSRGPAGQIQWPSLATADHYR